MIISVCPKLRVCSNLACGCDAFHNEGQGDAEPILEAFGRQFLKFSLKPTPSLDAQLFNIMLRIPLSLEHALQTFSGVSGVYFEPRGDTPQDASVRYGVIWVPRADLQSIQVLKQGAAAAGSVWAAMQGFRRASAASASEARRPFHCQSRSDRGLGVPGGRPSSRSLRLLDGRPCRPNPLLGPPLRGQVTTFCGHKLEKS